MGAPPYLQIYALSWAGDRIVTASQDGRLIVWNAMTGAKTHAIKLVRQGTHHSDDWMHGGRRRGMPCCAV